MQTKIISKLKLELQNVYYKPKNLIKTETVIIFKTEISLLPNIYFRSLLTTRINGRLNHSFETEPNGHAINFISKAPLQRLS